MAANLGLCSVAEPTDGSARANGAPGDSRPAHHAADFPHQRWLLCQAYAALTATGPTVKADEYGWDVPTATGLAQEAAVRAVGNWVAASATLQATPAIEAAERRFTDPVRRSAAVGAILANAYQRILGEVRSIGPGPEGVRTVRATRPLARLLHRVAAHYPREWIADSNAAHDHADGDDRPHGIYLTRHPSRASYDGGSTITRAVPGDETITFTADVLYLRAVPRGWRGRGYAVACHEFAHRCEHLRPGIGELSRVFVARRAIDPVTGRRERLLSYPEPDLAGPTHAEHVDYSESEWVQPSGLIDSYMGKIYRNRQYHEILSTGMEALFAGAYGGLIGAAGDYRADLEHRDFVLGLLAVL